MVARYCMMLHGPALGGSGNEDFQKPYGKASFSNQPKQTLKNGWKVLLHETS